MSVNLWPQGYDRLILDQVDSTMEEARRRAPDLTNPTWILAHNQTAARGRRGRAWTHPTGNFSATLVLYPNRPAAEAALLSFVSANALFDVLKGLAPRARIAQKWPNDVLLNGGKIAGILLESAGQAARPDWVSIGIGVNLKTAPEVADAAFPPVSLAAEMGLEIASEGFLDLLALAFAEEYQVFDQRGFAPVRQKWKKNAARLGEVIHARIGAETHTGRFEDIDYNGQLVLSTSQGRRAYPAADVFF